MSDIPLAVLLIGLVALFAEARVSRGSRHDRDAGTVEFQLRTKRRLTCLRWLLWTTLVLTALYLWKSSDDVAVYGGAAATGALVAYLVWFLVG